MKPDPPDPKPTKPENARRGRLPEEDVLKDCWLPEVGTKIPGRKGWRADLAKLFLPYR